MKTKTYIIVKINKDIDNSNKKDINNSNKKDIDNSNKKNNYDFIFPLDFKIFKKNFQTCEKEKYRGFIDSDYSELKYNDESDK